MINTLVRKDEKPVIDGLAGKEYRKVFSKPSVSTRIKVKGHIVFSVSPLSTYIYPIP